MLQYMRYPLTILITLGLTLGACAGPGSKEASTTGDVSENGKPAGKQFETKVVEAAASPLSDLNLVHAKVPGILQEAQKGPYRLPEDQSCNALAIKIRELDTALGADLDTPPTSTNPGLLERGTTVLNDATVGAVRDTVTSVVPYRGWIRKLSGAEKYSKEVSAAIAAGGVRRAFLKGYHAARDCPAVPPTARKE